MNDSLCVLSYLFAYVNTAAAEKHDNNVFTNVADSFGKLHLSPGQVKAGLVAEIGIIVAVACVLTLNGTVKTEGKNGDICFCSKNDTKEHFYAVKFTYVISTAFLAHNKLLQLKAREFIGDANNGGVGDLHLQDLALGCIRISARDCLQIIDLTLDGGIGG